MALLIVAPPIQLASTDPLKWEKYWDDLLCRAHSHPNFSQRMLRRAPPGSPTSFEAHYVQYWLNSYNGQYADTKNDAIHQYRELRLGLCSVQADIVVQALDESFVRDVGGFKDKWMSATPEERGEHFLAAMCSTCSAATNLHQARAYCATELKLESHQKDGRLFLKFLKEITEGASPDDPVYISHPIWDALAAKQRSNSNTTENEKLALGLTLVTRNKLIAHVVQYVLRSVMDLPLPQIAVFKHWSNKKSAIRTNPSTQVTPQLTMGLGKAGAKAYIRAEREARKELFSTWKQTCQACWKPNENDTRYSRCKRCWENMQREVLYCSAACQKADWQAGHKATCGKPLTFEDGDATSATPSPTQRGGETKDASSSLIGPPVAGFKRSPALLSQIKHINAYPMYDYFVSVKGRLVYFIFPHPPVQSAFRAARDRALTTGDRDTVVKLLNFLLVSAQLSRAPALGVSDEVLLKQVVAEFKFGAQGLERAMYEMKERSIADPLHRPPLLIDEGGFEEAEWEEYQRTWRNGLADVGIISTS